MGSTAQKPQSYNGGTHHLLWAPGMGNEAFSGEGVLREALGSVVMERGAEREGGP